MSVLTERLDKHSIRDWFADLQKNICSEISQADGGADFIFDVWERPEGGGGCTRILQNGNILEKAGVGFTAASGILSPKAVASMVGNTLASQSHEFFATGVSIVMHPRSPMVPIIHMNVRYFELTDGIWWFGGGIDLTPHYVIKEDAVYFHQALKNVCDAFDASYYAKFKAWADDYFFITHRNETRGIGGIFFDQLKADESHSKEQIFEFVKAVGNAFAPTYAHILKKNANLPYSEVEKEWQSIRRGRYVEFNLVLDRGTKFGLETNGRTESILMSMPPMAKWGYNLQPKEGTPEFASSLLFQKGINWV
jgi:coproporphyrinogen III oxidase